MTLILLLFTTGALLLAAEIFLPGGIAGVLGGIALLAGSIFAFLDYGVGGGALATLAAFALVSALLYAELVWLPRSKVGRAMVVESSIDAQSQPPIATQEVIGQSATALTALVPSGVVSIGGKRYEAFCRTGHAARGAALTVVGLDNFRLIVSETKTP